MGEPAQLQEQSFQRRYYLENLYLIYLGLLPAPATFAVLVVAPPRVPPRFLFS